ncbi:glycosyltransferase [Arthrobacter sp. GN70]|uniref:Glycosyltransferase family 2 protein n=2 Tax=Arthrobacter TaxID=1663 RepID=A0A4V2ZSC7_9MICC|nr:glycosyltransferase [Arthrobacter sp. GN70]TDF92704.1 glycosyltransferase family 2 protein [Arthrobacter terricola]
MAGPSVSIVICCFTEDRWDLLLRGIGSVLEQSLPPEQVIVVVDHNRGLYLRLAEAVTGVEVVENSGPTGLSGARNTGVQTATGEIVVFLDDDAEATSDWLARLVPLYDDPDVLAVGGRVEPVWESGRPAYFPEELDWIVGCTYRGLPRVATQVRNVIGANMSFRHEVFEQVGGFHASLGRQGARPLGCEETEMCIRASINAPGTRVVYEPAAVVLHHVPANRGTLRYILARAWSEGVSKAQVTRLSGRAEILGPERRYVRRVLPRAVFRGLRSFGQGGDPGGVARAGVVVAVLAVTAVGYLNSLWQASSPRRRQPGTVFLYRRIRTDGAEAGTND